LYIESFVDSDGIPLVVNEYDLNFKSTVEIELIDLFVAIGKTARMARFIGSSSEKEKKSTTNKMIDKSESLFFNNESKDTFCFLIMTNIFIYINSKSLLLNNESKDAFCLLIMTNIFIFIIF
jgi:hypothetical protein